jgi:hypothetical protein
VYCYFVYICCSDSNIGLYASTCVSFMSRFPLLILYIWCLSSIFSGGGGGSKCAYRFYSNPLKNILARTERSRIASPGLRAPLILSKCRDLPLFHVQGNAQLTKEDKVT